MQNLGNCQKVKLGDICQISTGKLDANAMVENGLYPFFTCAEKPFKINSYAFDTEALLISGNGANVGYINYYKGKFNAYQRTYVLSNFKEDIQYIKFYLSAFLHKRIELEKNTGNTPYIVLSTLSDMPIQIPSLEKQQYIAIILNTMREQICNAEIMLHLYKTQRQYLLRMMFV